MTKTSPTFSIGDYIVDFENIFKIISQKNQKNFSGQTLSYYFYEPILKSNCKATYSIPVDKIIDSGFRIPMNQESIENIYKKAEEKYDNNFFFDYKFVKEIIYKNDPEKNLQILKHLFFEKENNPLKFTRVNQDIFDSVLKHLSEEISFVSKDSVDNIQKKLIPLLKKSLH